MHKYWNTKKTLELKAKAEFHKGRLSILHEWFTSSSFWGRLVHLGKLILVWKRYNSHRYLRVCSKASPENLCLVSKYFLHPKIWCEALGCNRSTADKSPADLGYPVQLQPRLWGRALPPHPVLWSSAPTCRVPCRNRVTRSFIALEGDVWAQTCSEEPTAWGPGWASELTVLLSNQEKHEAQKDCVSVKAGVIILLLHILIIPLLRDLKSLKRIEL